MTTAVDRSAALARANPVSKLVVSLAVSVALLLTVDPVTAGTALLLELLCVPWCGLGWRAVARRAVLLVVAAVPAGVVGAVLGEDGGALLLDVGPFTVTEGSAFGGVSVALRILAIGLPGVVLLATTDPTDLADALAQLVRLPARFVLAALAALRLVGVLAEEWQSLSLARRARGLGGGGLVGRVRTLGGQVFALLVLAVRRGTVLATVMEARGFGAGPTRTWARRSRLGRVDVGVVVGGLTLAGIATAAGVLAGTWNLVLT